MLCIIQQIKVPRDMIQNIKSIIKLAYFSNPSPPPNTKSFKKHRPRSLQPPSRTPPSDLHQLLTLLHSQQRCQYWLLLAQTHKENFLVKQQLYNAIREGTVTVHNLFLLMIQCRVLPDQVWVPIEWLCGLEGDQDNQLCCLVHFTVMNLGKRHDYMYNPRKWSKEKAETELGPNFCAAYNNPQMTLQQKIAILPMLIVLNAKNSSVLWHRLPWLTSFPYSIIRNLHTNMRKLTEQRLSTAISLSNPQYFSSKMSIKAIQLLEVQGFVSVKNLFRFAYELYNISLLLHLLAGYEGASDDENHYTFRLQLVEFMLEFFDCMEMYEFQFDFGKDNTDMANLKQIIVKNRLYMEELSDIRFNQELQNMLSKYEGSQGYSNKSKDDNQDKQIYEPGAVRSIQTWFFNNFKAYSQTNSSQKNTNNMNITKLIPRSWSQFWLQEQDPNLDNSYNQQLDEDNQNQQPLLTPQKPQQKLSKFLNTRQQTILTHILNELYHLKTDYLQLLSCILKDCYARDEEPWSEINSSFYKLQCYLAKNYLFEFLVYNFNSLETKNDPGTMIGYYQVIGMVLRGNPISYGKIDKILISIEQNMGKASPTTKKRQNSRQNPQNGYHSPNLVQVLSLSFLQNVALSKTAILMILSDQFEWKQNTLQAYPNALYESYFVRRIIEMQRIEWMVIIVESVCCLCPYAQGIEGIKEGYEEVYERCGEKYEWVTLLLALYYYFQETVEQGQKNKKMSVKGEEGVKQKQKIFTPNKAYLDKIMQNQKFMEKLYPRFIEVPYQVDQNNELKIFCQQDNLFTSQSQNKNILVKQQRVLNVLIQILDRWQQFFNKNSKKKIHEYGLSYPMLRVFKKKLKSRINGFVKTKEFEQKGELCFQYSKRKKSHDDKQ